MTKEKQIILKHGLNKAKLVKLRYGSTMEQGVDWRFDDDKAYRRGGVLWTDVGLKKLYMHYGITEEPVAIPEPPKLKVEDVKKPDIVENSRVPGVVRQKFPNRRLVLCEIRGVKSLVVVRDSTNLRVGNILSVISRGNQLIGT